MGLAARTATGSTTLETPEAWAWFVARHRPQGSKAVDPSRLRASLRYRSWEESLSAGRASQCGKCTKRASTMSRTFLDILQVVEDQMVSKNAQ